MATTMTFGSHSNYGSTLIQALKAELRIPEAAQTTDIKSMVTEIGRVNGVSLSYKGENYGYGVECEDEKSLAFLKVFALRHGLSLK